MYRIAGINRKGKDAMSLQPVLDLLKILQILFLLPWAIVAILRSSKRTVPENRVVAGTIVFAEPNGRDIRFGIFESLAAGEEKMNTYTFPTPAPGLARGAGGKFLVHNHTCYAFKTGENIVRNPNSMLRITGLWSRWLIVPPAPLPGLLLLSLYQAMPHRERVLPFWFVTWAVFNAFCYFWYIPKPL